ncbi:MAG: MMPL family transporter, partial [Planctomycetaceae bacterium]|nr:MMPL family transporter [Planctomycetaceae bacterium]
MLRHETLLRLRWLPLAVMLLTAPLVTIGVIRLKTDSSGFVQWLPDNQRDKQEYLQFVELFGGDDYVLATWPGAGLKDSRLDNVADGLREADARRVAGGEPPLIDHINSGNSVYRELISEPLNLSPEEAVQRLQGILVGPDGETTGVIIQTTPAGKTRQQDVIEMVRQVASDAGGVPAGDLKLGGTIYEAVVIEQATQHSLRNFALPILLITLVLTLWCFRSVPLALIVLSCAVYCRSVSLALVYFTGNTLSAVLVVMPVLIYVLTISGAVHLVNYYRDALRSGSGARAPLDALRAGWLPCSMAAATTTIGLTSLAVSGIGPVRDFGMYSGISLLIAIAFLLTFLPAALTFLRPPEQSET